MSTADSHLPTAIREKDDPDDLYRMLEEIQKKLDWIIKQMQRELKSKL